MPRIDANFYKTVSALGQDTEIYSIPAGKKLRVMEIGGDAGNTPDTLVCIVYDHGGADEKILLATHGDASRPIDELLDGGKDVKIILDNDAAASESMGGWWRGHVG